MSCDFLLSDLVSYTAHGLTGNVLSIIIYYQNYSKQINKLFRPTILPQKIGGTIVPPILKGKICYRHRRCH